MNSIFLGGRAISRYFKVRFLIFFGINGGSGMSAPFFSIMTPKLHELNWCRDHLIFYILKEFWII